MEIKGNGKGYLRGTVVDLMDTAGNGRGWVPRKHYHKWPKPRKTTKTYKNSQNHPNYQTPSKSDGHQIPKLPKTTKT
jgi:hypothetical protein